MWVFELVYASDWCDWQRGESMPSLSPREHGLIYFLVFCPQRFQSGYLLFCCAIFPQKNTYAVGIRMGYKLCNAVIIALIQLVFFKYLESFKALFMLLSFLIQNHCGSSTYCIHVDSFFLCYWAQIRLSRSLHCTSITKYPNLVCEIHQTLILLPHLPNSYK